MGSLNTSHPFFYMSKKLSKDTERILHAHYKALGQKAIANAIDIIRQGSVMARLVYTGFDQPRIIPKDLKPLPGQDEYGRRNGT